ncbi:MAG: hypothetical protein Q7U97_13005 [Rhodocyclaceae bacterium]|nr:hypothetical protein [Rhodocyclaceae bacterium]
MATNRPLETFNPEVTAAIRACSFFEDPRSCRVLGTSAYASTAAMASDVDAFCTPVVPGATRKTAINNAVKEFQATIRRVLAYPGMSLQDVKAGQQEDCVTLDPKAGVVNMRVVNYNAVATLSRVRALAAATPPLISKEELTEAEAVIDAGGESPSVPQFLAIKAVLRYEVLRWTARDIAAGVLLGRGGQTISLATALGQPALCKYDVICPIGGWFTDMSFIVLVHRNDGSKLEPLNDFNADVSVESLTRSILLDAYSYALAGKYMKCAKRMAAVARVRNDKKDIAALVQVITSPALAQTLVALLESEDSLPTDKIDREVGAMVPKVWELQSLIEGEPGHAHIGDLLRDAAEIKGSKGAAALLNVLDKLADVLAPAYNESAKAQLTAAHLLRDGIPIKRFLP